MKLLSKGKALTWPGTVVMGVLNATPDSFSDGGRYAGASAAIERALEMLEEGAGIIDIGGESTRPGAQTVAEDEELARVLPVIQGIRKHSGTPISIDTSKPGVMTQACLAGADIINDVYALQTPGALEAAATTGAAVCLMHMQGEPHTMQKNPDYDDVVAQVRNFLAARVAVCEAAGIEESRIMVDPGFGFGKSLNHNLELLAGLRMIRGLGLPVLVGLSRKSMFKALLGIENPEERLAAGLAAASVAVHNGAAVVRTHDVAATRDAVAVVTAVNRFPSD